MSEALQNKLEHLITLIEDADAQVRSGVVINLPSLEKDVETLCATIVSGDAQTARDLQPIMAILIGKLDTLAESLQHFKNIQGEQ